MVFVSQIRTRLQNIMCSLLGEVAGVQLCFRNKNEHRILKYMVEIERNRNSRNKFQFQDGNLLTIF